MMFLRWLEDNTGEKKEDLEGRLLSKRQIHLWLNLTNTMSFMIILIKAENMIKSKGRKSIEQEQKQDKD